MPDPKRNPIQPNGLTFGRASIILALEREKSEESFLQRCGVDIGIAHITGGGITYRFISRHRIFISVNSSRIIMI